MRWRCLITCVGFCTWACFAGADEAASADLQIFAWNIAAGALKEIVPAFTTEFPAIHPHVNMSGAQLQARFMLSLAAGVGAPDITTLQYPDIERYAATGRLMDLTDFASAHRKDFPESVWRDCMHDGRVYAIPWDLAPCAVFYKRDLFAKYGIDPGAIQTWDDYIAAGERILKASGGVTRMLFHPTNVQEILFEIMLHEAGGQIFDESGAIVINSDATEMVLALLQRMVKSGISADVPYWTPAFFASFRGESVATFPMAVWFASFIRENAPDTAGNWGVFPLPALTPGGARVSTYGGSALVIPDQCAQKDAALSFIEFALFRRASQLNHFRTFDLFPAMTTVYDDPFFDAPVDFFGGQAVRKLFAQNVDRIPVMHRTSDWEVTRLYLRQALGRWAARGMDAPSEFLAGFESKLAGRLGREVASVSISKAALP